MAFNSLTDRTDAAALIPEEAAREILKGVAATNPLLQLARRLPDMPRARTRLPVLSVFPTANFVTGDTGLKQTTEVNWTNKYIDAEEVAVIVPIPQAVLDDADYDIWAEIRPEIVTAFNVAITAAVLHGTNIPASWTVNLGAAGLLAVIVAAAQTVDESAEITATHDYYYMLMGAAGAIAMVEADGFIPTGHIGALSMRGKLRGLRDSATGMPIFVSSMQDNTRYQLDGAPIYFPTDGSINPAAALLFTGQWDQLVWSMRQDMTFKLSTEGTISDGAGVVISNLFQQDMVALRCVMRIGFALPNPINRINATAATRCAFAALVP